MSASPRERLTDSPRVGVLSWDSSAAVEPMWLGLAETELKEKWGGAALGPPNNQVTVWLNGVGRAAQSQTIEAQSL